MILKKSLTAALSDSTDITRVRDAVSAESYICFGIKDADILAKNTSVIRFQELSKVTLPEKK